MPTVYALLIAINEYPIPQHRLSGCVNDMLLMENYLETHFPKQLKLRVLQDDAATRQAVIDAFTHFDAAQDDDVCFLYYSGHGSQAAAPKEFWTESDGMNESIVLYDSRLPGGRDLMDKELAYLIWKANQQKNIHFVAMMDCCHSGHSTRFAEAVDIQVRMVEPSFTPGTLADYVGYESYHKTEHPDGQLEVAPPTGRHLLLAAAKSYQTAKEKTINGERHGVFTYSAIAALEEQGGRISYDSLIQQATIRAAQLVDAQAPQLESTQAGVGRTLFLTGSETLADSWLVSFDKGQWWLNAGKVQGIQSGGKLRLIEPETDITLGDVAVARSAIASGTTDLDTAQQYRVRYQPPADQQVRIAVGRDSDPKAESALSELRKSTYDTFSLTNQVADARFLIRAGNEKLWLSLPTSGSPLFLPVDGYDKAAVVDLADKIETVMRWHRLLDVNNPRTRLQDKDVTIEVQRVTDYDAPTDASPSESIVNPAAPVACYYRFQDGNWQWPYIRLKVTNNSTETLYVSGLYLSVNYEISNAFLQKAELAPGQSTWMTYDSSRTLPLFIWPDMEQFKELGINEITEHIKLLISTEDFSTDQYNQAGIDLVNMRDAQDKGIGLIAPTRPKLPDWTARTVTLNIICPPDSATVSPTKDGLVHGLVIKPHPTLSANVTLTSVQDATRSLGNESAVNDAFHRFFDDDFSQPISFALNTYTGTRGMSNSPGLNVVELVDVQGSDSVTPEHPFQLDASAYLQANETLLPFGYDEETGQFFPLGFERKGVVEVEQLPRPTAIGVRSLGGSIKLFFKKLVTPKQPTGVLSLVVVDEQENVTRIRDDEADGLQKITDAVAKASRVLLFIHGIIGDTEEMVKAVRRVKFTATGDTMLTHYDVVLAFDYENLDTEIQQTAKQLSDRLQAVGFKATDGKTLHLMAHSMGGLVSRWLIEKGQGSQYVDHLIMLGTPNHGSPWSDVEAMVVPLITKAINGSALVKPYLIPLALLGKQANRMFTTLRQMHKDSEFLISLNDGTIASVPYTIIAGNTKLVPVVYEKDMALWRKIWVRFKERAAYTLLDTFLFHDANDIAVLVTSIQDVAGPQVVKQVPIACDHISYFCDDDSLKCLGECMITI
ncbi:caspase family protein [Spirosoma sp. KNUC1025]|uniref:caspase family protein n=1 Tax=Spirosoma sp. KNUC1025 TaxID=2894082 RepID=UPI003867382A|nr:caspase family protein [Spirosoma sp. KNUC1025]